MAGGCQASAHLVPRVAHTGLTASPTLTQSIPYANPTPQHLQSCAHSHTGAGGRENSQKQNPHTPTVSLRPCELHLSLPLAWADLPVASVGPTLYSPKAIADHRCLHPYRAILLTSSIPVPLLYTLSGQTLVAARSSGSPAPHPLLPSFSLSLSFFPSSVCRPL